MPLTFEKIATYTVPSQQSAITFNSIPGTYTDLYISAWLQTNRSPETADACFVTPNGGAATCTNTVIAANATTFSSARVTSANAFTGLYHEVNSQGVSSYFSHHEYHFNNYTAGYFKSVIYTKNLSAQNNVGQYAGTVMTGSAITSISWGGTIGGNFMPGSIITLYGILKA